MACCVLAAWLYVQVRSGLAWLRTALLGSTTPEKLNTAVAWNLDRTVPMHGTSMQDTSMGANR